MEALNTAYRAFQLGGREGAVTDQDIIGSFTATLADSPSHEHDLREYLRIIGIHRNSKRIMDTARDGKRAALPCVPCSDMHSAVIDSYEQALLFLDAHPSTEDEHIQALFAVKVCSDVPCRGNRF